MIPPSRRSIWGALEYPALCVVGIVGAVLFPDTHHKVSGSALLANWMLLVVMLVPSTLVHEAGHLLAARALGLSVYGVYLGRGPLLWQKRVGSTVFVLQRVPFTGATMFTAPTATWLRLRLVLVYAAGPLTNALLLGGILVLHPSPLGSFVSGSAPLLALVVTNGAFAVLNLVPEPPRGSGGARTLGSDGWNLLTVPFRTDASLRPIVIAHAAWKVSSLTEQGKAEEAGAVLDGALAREPGSPILRAMHTDRLIVLQKWAEAAGELRLLLDDPALVREAPEAAPTLANNLAWADFMLDDPDLLEEADRRSKEAFDWAPLNPSCNGTRGAVLLARGNLSEAESPLRFAAERSKEASHALSACCLAILFARKGDDEEARAWLAKARAADPRCYLLDRAEASMAKASAGPNR